MVLQAHPSRWGHGVLQIRTPEGPWPWTHGLPEVSRSFHHMSYKIWSPMPPALIAGGGYSHGFRANSWAKWLSPKPISCLAEFGMFFASK